MLSPNTLEYIADDIVAVYSRLNERIVEDIARRLVNAGTMTESARWQIQIAQETGLLYDNIIQMVSDNMEVSDKVVKDIFEEATIESFEFDDRIYLNAGLNPIPVMQSPTMLNILTAGLIKTNGNMNNLCMTTASSGQDSFTEALDEAYMEVITGAFDYNTAIFNVVDKISKDGMYVYYPSGYREKIDVAVRKNVVTGVGQTTGQMQIERAKELGTDLMELTAHEGARPTHELWQGKIVSLSGRKGYLSLTDIGYGTPTGFKGINCRHDWFPFFEGIDERTYTDKELKELNNQTVRYNGKDIKIYDARQIQRSLERNIRENKRQLAGLNGILISNTDNKELIEEARSRFTLKSVELKQRESILKDFSEQTGLKRDRARERINKFDKSVSQKTLWSYKNEINSNDENVLKSKLDKNNDIKLKDISSKKEELIDKMFINDNIKKIALNTKVKSISTGGNKSYHTKGKVVLKENFDNKSFIHEMAHNIDYQNKWLTSDKKYIQAIEKDRNTIYNNKKVYRKLVKENKELIGISDILSGITNTKIQGRYKHSKKYWKKPNKIQREIFSQLFVMAAEDDFYQLKLTKKYFPNIFKEFDRLIGGLL